MGNIIGIEFSARITEVAASAVVQLTSRWTKFPEDRMKRFLMIAALAGLGVAMTADPAEAFGRRKRKKECCPEPAPACCAAPAPAPAPCCGDVPPPCCGAPAPVPAAPVAPPQDMPKPAPKPTPKPAPAPKTT